MPISLGARLPTVSVLVLVVLFAINNSIEFTGQSSAGNVIQSEFSASLEDDIKFHSLGTLSGRLKSAQGSAPNGSGTDSRRNQPEAANSSTAAAPAALSELLNVQVTAIHVDRSEFPLDKLLFKLTLRLAIREASKLLAHRRVRLSMSVRSANTCSHQYAGAIAADEYYRRRSKLFIVSGCRDAIRSVSRLASGWRVPVMTAAGFGADLNDKRVHRTLIRIAFSLKAAVEFLFKLMKSFKWRRANLIVDESDSNSAALRTSIEQHMGEFCDSESLSGNSSGQQTTNRSDFCAELNTIPLDLLNLLNPSERQEAKKASNSSRKLDVATLADKWPNEIVDQIVHDALRQSAAFSRVTIVLLPQVYLRRFMLSAYDLGMANGQYTFINVPLLLADEEEGPVGNNSASGQRATGASQSGRSAGAAAAATIDSEFLWRSFKSPRNAHAKRAFESLMSIYLRAPTGKAYVFFASKLQQLAGQVRQTQLGNSSQEAAADAFKSRRLRANPYVASFYDCLQIYSLALDESLGVALAASATTSPRNNSSSAERADWQQLETWRRLTRLDLHANISELVRNKRFENMVTGTVLINANGDRETDYTLDDMNHMTGRYQPVIVFHGETGDIERLGRIHWSSDAAVGPTSDSVDCALVGTCTSRPLSRFSLILIFMFVPIAVALSSLAYFVYTRLSLEAQLVDYWWRIHMDEIELVETRRKNADGSTIVLSGAGSELSGSQTRQTSGGGANTVVGGSSAAPPTAVTRATGTSVHSALDVCFGNISLGLYKLSKVALKPVDKLSQSRKLMVELRTIKTVNHANLCRFVGLIVDEGQTAIVSEFCAKGSLREFFQNKSMVIDWTFKYSIINDILSGLVYLHSSALSFHGRLKSNNCLVNARFVVKLSDYGPHSLYKKLDELETSPEAGEQAEQDYLRKRLCLAPEHMSLGSGGSAKLGSPKGDVYSFGLLLYEIITNSVPFYDQKEEDFVLPMRELFAELKSKGPLGERTGLRLDKVLEEAAESDDQVAIPTDLRPVFELMKSCLEFEPDKRPSLGQVSGALRKITRGATPKKLLENLSSRMEQYTNNLESLVDAKLASLIEEKSKCEELLYQFVPKSIAQLLKEGQSVEPEAFECVTVFYSDIVGFTSLSAESTPLQVVDFLSNLYLCFDETLEQYDIFKVDTIGDAYIVASGLPQRNGTKHVVEIACAALELRERLEQFKVAHKPDWKLQMRVGVHSGCCVAGVVGGLQMPKYCVFGDTLTIGKFMESNGLPMRIHITSESKALLCDEPSFAIEPRVPKITRDGLPFETFWLERSKLN